MRERRAPYTHISQFILFFPLQISRLYIGLTAMICFAPFLPRSSLTLRVTHQPRETIQKGARSICSRTYSAPISKKKLRWECWGILELVSRLKWKNSARCSKRLASFVLRRARGKGQCICTGQNKENPRLLLETVGVAGHLMRFRTFSVWRSHVIIQRIRARHVRTNTLASEGTDENGREKFHETLRTLFLSCSWFQFEIWSALPHTAYETFIVSFSLWKCPRPANFARITSAFLGMNDYKLKVIV